MAKVTKKVKEAPVVEEVVEQEVLAEVTDEQVMELQGEAPVVYADEFAYEIKAGKGTFPNMSADDVMMFMDATLGKVDKHIITRQ